MYLLSGAALLLFLVLAAAQTPQTLEIEPMVSNRVKLPFFCLGPAPFPVNLDHLEFEMFGNAHVDKGLMKLTDAVTSQRSAIWSKRPITKLRNFQIDLRFQVGGSPNLEHFGDGFALWITTERGVAGSDALGGPDEFTGLAVFFDTFKNDNFRGKKHPWVYGKSSKDGTEVINYKTLTDSNTVGCHAPFRDSDPNVMATTVARITLMDNLLSVVLRPKGAVDWIQCFEIPNVRLPENAYLGVSAMTGNLVDNHHFLQLTTYSNIDVQPFSYAHSYKLNQMPEMWKQMKESGKIAREFTDWEESDSFSDDLHWTLSGNVKSHITDDYDDPYLEDEQYGGDDADPYRAYDEDDEEEEDEEDDETSSARITRPKPDTVTAEQAIMARDLEKVLQKSFVASTLTRQHQKNADMMENMHLQLQNSMQDVADQLHLAAREIRVKEHELSERVLAVGTRVRVTVIDPFEQKVIRSGSNWFWPFMIMITLIAGMGAFGYTRYKKFMKQHVL